MRWCQEKENDEEPNLTVVSLRKEAVMCYTRHLVFRLASRDNDILFPPFLIFLMTQKLNCFIVILVRSNRRLYFANFYFWAAPIVQSSQCCLKSGFFSTHLDRIVLSSMFLEKVIIRNAGTIWLIVLHLLLSLLSVLSLCSSTAGREPQYPPGCDLGVSGKWHSSTGGTLTRLSPSILSFHYLRPSVAATPKIMRWRLGVPVQIFLQGRDRMWHVTVWYLACATFRRSLK